MIGQDADAIPHPVFISPTMQRSDDQVVTAGSVSDPPHAVRGGFVAEFDRFPALSAILRRHEIENGTAVHGVAGIPLSTHGNLALAIAIDVAGSNADVILVGEFFSDDVLFPLGVLVPGDEILIRQKNIRPAIAIHIRQRKAVTDAHIGVDFLSLEIGYCLGRRRAGRTDHGGGHEPEEA